MTSTPTNGPNDNHDDLDDLRAQLVRATDRLTAIRAVVGASPPPVDPEYVRELRGLDRICVILEGFELLAELPRPELDQRVAELFAARTAAVAR